MPKQHIVSPGECLSRIAHQYGFYDYLTIYEDAGNVEFRRKRPNPNLIHPGDVIVIPDIQEKTESRSTGNKHIFTVKRTRRYVRLRLHYHDGQPIAATPYKFTCGAQVLTGQTDGNGMLEKEVPRDAETAQVEIAGFTWTVKIAHLNPMDNTPDEGVSGYQSRLRNLGYDTGPIDGVAGKRTARAVRVFQADYPPLKVDGICGPQTQAKLKEIHGS
jgi:Putative peptidoglycan binding domain